MMMAFYLYEDGSYLWLEYEGGAVTKLRGLVH